MDWFKQQITQLYNTLIYRKLTKPNTINAESPTLFVFVKIKQYVCTE